MEYSLNEGPDQIVPTSNITTTEPDGAIKIRQVGNEDCAILPESIPGLLARIADLHPDKPALAFKKDRNEKGFHIVTYREYLTQVRTVAKAFLKLGLERYHSVAIIGFNSQEWLISYLAAIHAGGFATGIYTTNSPEACFYCLENSRANVVIAGDQTLVDKIVKHKRDLPNLKKIIQYEGTPAVEDVLSWNDLLNIGQGETDVALDNVLKKISLNQCAAIVYTSGTVGNPKPVMVSHDNLIIGGKIINNAIGMGEDESAVSYLPLSHMAAQILDIFMPIATAGTIYFADKDVLKGTLIKTLSEVRPTFFFGVPRVWEKIGERLKEIGAKAGLVDPSIVKKNLGLDRCKRFYSGAAPSSMDIKNYFAGLDIPIMEVYGMTECSGPQTINIPTAFCFESVGKTIPGVKTKIHAPDQDNQGEICMYGRNVFMGYLNDRKNTDEAIDSEGWLHSGDIGKIDENGFLYITGRQKEIIITTGGENIPPVLIEENIKTELPCLGYAVLIGDKRKYLTVLLTLSCVTDPETGEASEQLTELTKKWLKDLGCPFNTIREVIASGPDEKITKAIQSAIDAANLKAISNAQKVQKFAVLHRDFSMSTGEIGPTLKLKRNVVYSKFKDVIDKLY